MLHRILLYWQGQLVYDTLVIWADEPLRDFSFVSLTFNSDYGESDEVRDYFYTREVLLTIDELTPTDAVVLNVFFPHYLISRGGVVFTDADGIQRRMFIAESMRGGCWPHFYLSPHNDETHWADWR